MMAVIDLSSIRNVTVETTSTAGRNDMAGTDFTVRWEQATPNTPGAWTPQVVYGLLGPLPGPADYDLTGTKIVPGTSADPQANRYVPGGVAEALIANDGKLLPRAIRSLHADPREALRCYQRAKRGGYIAG